MVTCIIRLEPVSKIRWRLVEPPGLQLTANKLMDALSHIKPNGEVYDATWVTWSAWRARIEQWKSGTQPRQELERAFVVARAHGLDVLELNLARRELLRYDRFVQSGREYDMDGSFTHFEKSCAALVEGLALIDKAGTLGKKDSKKEDLLRGATLIESSLPMLWNTLPEVQRKRVVKALFFDAIVTLTFDDHHKDLIDRALTLASKLSIPLAGNIWAGLFHNMGRYDKSCKAASAGLADNPSETFLWRVLIHNLLHHLHRYEEANTAADKALAEDVFDDNLIIMKSEILEKLGKNDEAITLLESRSEFNPELNSALSRRFIQIGRLDDAERCLRRAIEVAPFDTEVAIELADLVQSRGKVDESIGLYEYFFKEDGQRK